MTTTPQEAGTEEDAVRLDALRRRLYRAGATDDDVRRYVAEQQAHPLEQPASTVAADEAAPPRRGLRRAGWTVAVALAAAAAVTVVAQQSRAPSPIEPGPSARIEPVVVQDVGEGQVLDLADGSASAPVAAAVSVRGVAVVGQRVEGSGNAVVAFTPPTKVHDGGRAQVTLTVDAPASVRWRALLRVDRSDWSTYPVVMARGVSDGRTGPGAPVTFVYPTRPPTAIAVEAPAGVPWTLEVAATDGLEPTLR